MSDRPIGIELFAGAGGMSLGFEQAGFDVVAAVEIDPVHAATHHFNFPQTTVLPRSVVGLRGEELRKVAGIGNRSVDVVFGGPPCQGFSLIGQRVFDDPRNHLVKEFVRIVSELEPKMFVFENVKGLTVGKHQQFLNALIDEFEVAGYSVRTPWLVMNAMHHGVPQNRERLFLLGARKRKQLPLYPVPTTSIEKSLFSGQGCDFTPTCSDALLDLPDAEDFEELLTSDSVRVQHWSKSSTYACQCRCEAKSDWFFGYERIWDRQLLTSSMRTDHTEISRRRFSSTLPGNVEPISRFYKLDPNGVCNTLRAGTDSARGAFTSPRPIHFLYNRCITVREMARLHGYPDWFRFHATKWNGARQVGNSVPPPLARAVAGCVINALDVVSSFPDKRLDLGDPALLTMDMRTASKFWKIPVPISRRDRKSGSRKRKQIEIEAEMTMKGQNT